MQQLHSLQSDCTIAVICEEVGVAVVFISRSPSDINNSKGLCTLYLPDIVAIIAWMIDDRGSITGSVVISESFDFRKSSG